MSHAQLLSVSKRATTPIYQSVRCINPSLWAYVEPLPFLLYCAVLSIAIASHTRFICTVYSFIVSREYIHTVRKRYAQSHTHLSCLAATCKLTWNRTCWLIVDFNFTYLAISSYTALVESWVPRKLILAHASVFFNPGHIRIWPGLVSGSPGQQ